MGATGYFTHSDCRLHEMGEGHPECPQRLDAIEDRLLITGLGHALDRREPSPASLADIELAHGSMYVASLRGLSDALIEDIQAGGPSRTALDPDTSMNAHTWKAVLRSAGAALEATDAVIAGELENAFCAIRPPGHHACRDKAMGFCFFNNVAIAAKYALERHGLKRVAIVDFDVHHGNGTQDILINDPNVLFISNHQYPHYPGSGSVNEIGMGNVVNIPFSGGVGDDGLQKAYTEIAFPLIKKFAPDFIFVSAGYDGHWRDQLAGLNFSLEGFSWISKALVELSNEICEGKIVFTLEGGYDLEAGANGVSNSIKALLGRDDFIDPIGESSRTEPDVTDLIYRLKTLHGLVVDKELFM